MEAVPREGRPTAQEPVAPEEATGTRSCSSLPVANGNQEQFRNPRPQQPPKTSLETPATQLSLAQIREFLRLKRPKLLDNLIFSHSSRILPTCQALGQSNEQESQVLAHVVLPVSLVFFFFLDLAAQKSKRLRKRAHCKNCPTNMG